MLRSIIVATFRNIKLRKLNFLVTMSGLIASLTIAFFCYLYVIHELNYDQHHVNENHIYRMITKDTHGGFRSSTPFILKETLTNTFSEIESVAQVSQNWQPCFIKRNGNILKENPEFYTDPEIFKILTLSLKQGNPATCLADPNNVVISEKFAAKFFPEENPMNKLIEIKTGESYTSFRVTGILRTGSNDTFFRPDILLPMTALSSRITSDMLTGWNGSNPHTFILFKEHASISDFTNKLPAFSEECVEKGYNGTFEIQALSKMHLYSTDISGTPRETGSMSYVLIFASIGVMILLMGSVNFINLSTAQAMTRATEIGIRKVIGASKSNIRIQYLLESIIIAFIAFPFSLVLLELFIPFGSKLINRTFDSFYLTNYIFISGILFITILVGIFSGSYNAFYVSKLQAIDALKSKTNIGSSKSPVRRVLLTLQFVIFGALVISSVSMFQQMYYIQHKQLGYNKEQLFSLNLPVDIHNSAIEAFKNEIKSIPGVKDVTISSFVPPAIGNWLGTHIPDPKQPDKNLDISYIISDLDYFKTIEFNVKYGRFYTAGEEDLSNRRLVLNEAATRLLGIDTPIGHKINMWGGDWEIIGVIKDFHTHSLHSKIPPLFFFSTDKIDDFFGQFLSNYAIRLQAGTIPSTLAQIENTWDKFFPDTYFDYRFADDEFNKLHRNDRHLSQLLLIITITAILISCMGLFGLISFTTQRRTKEIGIRKSFGASRIQILTLLIKELVVIFTISIFISIPVVAYLINNWLEDFSYKADIGVVTFLIAAILSLLIMLSAVSWQALKATLANPVESLKYE